MCLASQVDKPSEKPNWWMRSKTAFGSMSLSALIEKLIVLIALSSTESAVCTKAAITFGGPLWSARSYRMKKSAVKSGL
jgi:hypothetical protein